MYSFVIPLYNEEESIEQFYKELSLTLPTLTKEYEILFIDDGSKDQSLEILKRLAKRDKNIHIYSFRKNSGKAEALTYGFQKAKGSFVITLDADLQDKPSEIKKLIEKLDKGWDVVCGWRKERRDPIRKIISSKLFNYLTNLFWGLRLHDYNCGLKAYTADAAKSLFLYGGMHRFIPALAHQQGFQVTEVPISHDVRKFGSSKYGFSKIWKDIPDIFTMLFLVKYSNRPMHFFGVVGGGLFTTGMIILIYLSIIHFMGEAIGRRPLLFLGMLLVIGGFQVFFTGFLGDLIINVVKRNSRSSLSEDMTLKYTSNE